MKQIQYQMLLGGWALICVVACQSVPQEIQVRLIMPSTPARALPQAQTALQTEIVVKTPSPPSSATASPEPESTETPLPQTQPGPAAEIQSLNPLSVLPTPPTPQPLPTPVPLPLISATPVATPLPTPTPMLSPQPTPTPSPIATPSLTPSPTPIPTPTPSPSASAPAPTAPLPEFTNSLGMHFRQLPAGTFTMGSPTSELGRKEDELQHEVSLSGFWMQSTEVTQAQFLAVMGYNPSFFPANLQHPVEMVSWNQADSFVQALNQRGEGRYRLPSEAEWEYAARAGSSKAYSCGDVGDPCLTGISWYVNTTGGTQSRPVATKQANAWGLYDMHGNVSEWVNDWYGSYATSPQIQPTGPGFGSHKVNRSGSWGGQPQSLRAAQRTSHLPTALSSKLGFRVVYEPGTSP